MSDAGKKPIDSVITALAAWSDATVDTSQIPEVTDWSRAAVGRFYDAGKTRVTVVVDDVEDDRAAPATAITQKSRERFWNLGGVQLPWRAAALAGLACLTAVAVVLAVRTTWISTSGGHGGQTLVSNGSTKPAGLGNEATFPEIAALSSDEQSAVRKALSSGTISIPSSLSDLREKLGPLRHESPGNQAFRVVEPAGEVVLDPRPLFRWQPLAEAASYSVVIFDTKGVQVQASPATHSTLWKPAYALQRGLVYQWQVRAVMGNGSSMIAPSLSKPEAKFRVLDQAKADELTRFRQAHSEAHLVLGILSAEAGLLEDAERELGEVQQNDHNFELAQNLLRSVRELRQPL